MFRQSIRQTTIALGLTLVSGAALAAGVNIGLDSEMPVNMQFNMLDSNGDGAISRVEAQASSELSALYDSFDTSATIEKDARQASVNGVTRAQFQAGLEALGKGVIGPAASGGGTYILMEDGSKVRRDELFQDSAPGY